MVVLVWALAALILLCALAYAMAAMAVLVSTPRRLPCPATARRMVSIFKPLCGDEPGLYNSLQSFFLLDPSACQLIFGVRNPSDPALRIVEQLQRDFPLADVAIVRDGRVHGSNLKVSNLMNMAPFARHDLWIISDSDIRIDADYLGQILSPFDDPHTGAVTALYRAYRMNDRLPGKLAALHIEDIFLPSVLVARRLGRKNFCLGSTMALHRKTLEQIGGFEALKDYLADDYMLGHLVAQTGMSVALAEGMVATAVNEASFTQLIEHELRWGRTIRSVEPRSYMFSCITHTFAMSLIAGVLLACASAPIAGLGAAGLGLSARLALHHRVNIHLNRREAFYGLALVRDLLSFAIWAGAFMSRTVAWRGQRHEVEPGGILSNTMKEQP